MELYVILWVSKTATKEEIKKAYRKLAMQYHPDRNPWDSSAEAKFKEIWEAYSVLSDDSKRKQYDTFGTTWWNWWWGNPFWGWFWWWVDVDLSDIFESFFSWGWSSRWRSRRSTSRVWEDLEYLINVSLEDSIFWSKKEIKFDKEISCPSCNWEWWSWKSSCSWCNWSWHKTYTTQSMFWTIQQTWICDECDWKWEKITNLCDECRWTKRIKNTKEIEIDIPAWIDSWMIIKMEWEWNDWVWTSQAWDLYIKFNIKKEEKWLRRDWVNLYYDLEIDVIEAILGTTKDIKLPILWNRVIEIPSWTQYQTVIKKVWDWVKYIDSDKKWDLFINIDIKIPKKLKKSERSMYEEIAKEKKINVHNNKWILDKLFW